MEKIEAVIQAWLPQKPDASWAAAVFQGLEASVPPNLTQSLTLPGCDLLNRGGKRWRPLLMALVCEALGGGEEAVSLAPLVEFPHNASLIHDDIEDNSEERRGKPAVHLLYGADTAINSGCFLYFLPLSCISKWNAPDERKLLLFKVWGEFMRRLHLGQAMDIAWHRDDSAIPSLADYETMCRLKTGALARLAAALGVHCAAALRTELRAREAQLAETIGQAAESMGVGFQILDDVKNLTTGNPGKKRGDDIVEGKKSLPILLYLDQNKKEKEMAARCFSAARKKGIEAPEVEELIAALNASTAVEEARRRGLALIEDSQKVLGGELFRNPDSREDAAYSPVRGDALELLADFTGLLV